MLAAVVTIGVFGLFHPRALEIDTWGSSRVELSCAHRVLEGSARWRIASNCTASGVMGKPVDFVLSVPGRIRRHYQGTLRVTRLPTGELIAAVTMALETAVASTVAAESPPAASQTMLEAQAIVTRSYFAAGTRHRGFEFCDTTHCQFIKNLPPIESSPARAARATAGRVLTYRDRVVAAFYASRCEGLLAPLPHAEPDEYPYFAVKCDYCLRYPSKVSPKPNARPHHHGMCQTGAADLARLGWTAAQILSHYYPGTALR